jgi:alkylation response protein AidB-like acyl-CoA dehydrogenase
MDILNYTDDHKKFREDLRAFLAKEVNPFIPQWEKDHIVPKEVWRKMGEAGFLCTAQAKEFGGHGKDFLYSVIVCEETSRTGFTGLTASLHSDIVVPYIETFGTLEQKKKYIPKCTSGECISAVAMTEPDHGSDLASMTTIFEEDGDHYIINGTKTFISNGINCGLVVVAARDPRADNPYQAISMFIVEDGTPGFGRGKHLEKMGWHSQDTAELFFSKCRIPKANLLGQLGGGFIILMEKLQQERLVCAIGAVCAAEQVVEKVIEYCKNTKEPSGKPISKNQGTQFALVEMATEAKLGRVFVDKLIADHMEKKAVVVEVSMAKYWTTDLAKRTVDRAMDIVGDPGYLEAFGLARGFRDVRVMPIFAGTNEIMKRIAAGFMGL